MFQLYYTYAGKNVLVHDPENMIIFGGHAINGLLMCYISQLFIELQTFFIDYKNLFHHFRVVVQKSKLTSEFLINLINIGGFGIQGCLCII